MFMRYTGNGIGHKHQGLALEPLPALDIHDISTDIIDGDEKYGDKSGNDSESESASDSGSENEDEPREINQDAGDNEYETNESSL